MDESLKQPGSDDSLSCLPSPTCSKKLVSFMTAPPTSTVSTFSLRTNQLQPGFRGVKAQVGFNFCVIHSALAKGFLFLSPYLVSICNLSLCPRPRLLSQGSVPARNWTICLYCRYSISQDRHPNSKPNLRAGSPASDGRGLRRGSMVSSANQSSLSSL